MAQGEFKKYCQICGSEFITKTGKGKYCPICRKEQQRRQNRNNNRAKYEKKKTAKEQPTPHNHKILNDLMWELKAYNEKHNTKLSYGEYVLLIEGRI
jgi:uncharacterized Zn finger protein (UPF0148 family)